MKMKLIKKMLASAGGVTALVLLGTGVIGIPEASAGIANTKHNLGSSAGPADRKNSFSGTGEICVFCHTPHGSDTSAAVPLWNRTMATPSTYTTYNSLGTSSLDGATAQVGSVSLACLSCHDGTQAMNVLINQPGSGKTVASYGAGSWGTSTGVEADGRLLNSLIANLSKDLKNDHPIGIQYAGGPKSGSVPAAPAAYGETLFRDADFRATSSAVLNGQSVWWVDTPSVGTAGSREKTDMQLYTRTAAIMASDGVTTIAGSQPYVECASCHDPHTENTTFLRVQNTGSAVCLACHIK